MLLFFLGTLFGIVITTLAVAFTIKIATEGMRL